MTKNVPDLKSSSESSIGPAVIWLAAVLFFFATTSVSWLRWANFHYRTFDLAYYVQAIWQLIHGRFALTVENVPLLGNHVEPIIFLFAPIFALIRHPMVFVVIQNAAIATMGPIGYYLARRLGFDRIPAICLAIAVLAAPAAGYIALHEFHPEALAAPLLLLLFYSRATRQLWLQWVCCVAVLACKENMALLLGAYSIVFLVIERRRARSELIRWYAGPLVLAILWFVVCTKVIAPAFNSGNIDYLALYDRLGQSAGEIIWNGLTKPRLVFGALIHALRHGNLVWGLLLPFLGLPLLRPRWLIIAAPIFLQHLLSWRSSEWMIYFHYGAPLLPVMWIATAESLAIARDRWINRAPHAPASMEGRAPASPTSAASADFGGVAGAPSSIQTTPSRFISVAACLLVFACLTAQAWIGPSRQMSFELRNQAADRADRLRKEALINQIPATASVVAPLPYLSHLAMREKLYSLHYILKGLKTLSRQSYEPPAPTDFVFIDYNDSATFDAGAGYYHPQMKTADGRIIPSSDRLLHNFLSPAAWEVMSRNELTLFRKISPNQQQSPAPIDAGNGEQFGDDSGALARTGNELGSIRRAEPRAPVDPERPTIAVELQWRVSRYREIFPWMMLRLEAAEGARSFTKGFCAIELAEGTTGEHWETALAGLEPGEYKVEALFIHNAKRAWLEMQGGRDLIPALICPPIGLGTVTVPPRAK
ncbi:MAG TPA: DUF2079 domain-containing protein [Chthoniobacterales bacterium]|jgi:uncharacterized membrane protein